MTPLAMKDLLEAGVHFGHQTKRWNPKMKPYIFGERNGIYILDLGKTVEAVQRGRGVRHATGGRRQDASSSWAPSARRRTSSPKKRTRCGMYLRERALARRPADQLLHHPAQHRAPARSRGDGHRRPLRVHAEEGNCAAPRRRSASSRRTSTASATWARLPDALFVVDTRKEQIAVDEARKLKIPVIGVVDTNCDPDQVDFVIPGQRRRAALDPAVRVARRRRGDRRPLAERESQMAEQAEADAEAAAADEASRTVRPANLRKPQRPAESPAPTA